jgi:hypothetical protein
MNTDISRAGERGARGGDDVPVGMAIPAMDSFVFIRFYPCSSVFQGFAPTTGK